MSEIKSTMYQDFINAQKEFEPAKKDSLNPHFKSKYADLSNCIDAVKEALNNNGFGLIQTSHDYDGGVAVETVLYHKSGDCIKSGVLRLPASKQDAQGYGSAMTYARRYSLLAVCGIAPEDDDANQAKPPQKRNDSSVNRLDAIVKRFVELGVDPKEIIEDYGRHVGVFYFHDFNDFHIKKLSLIGTKVASGMRFKDAMIDSIGKVE